MKRSGREGRWADIPSARVRFAGEAAFLLIVAGGAALARLSPLQIILLMFVAWVLVALIERASSRVHARMPGAQAEGAVTPAVPEPEPEPVPEPEPQVAAEPRRWSVLGRRRKGAEPLPAPAAPLEERPSRAHVRRIEPEPAAELDAELAEILAAETLAPGPAVTKRALDLPGLEEAEAAPPPEPEPEPEPVPAAPAPVPQAPPVQARVEPPPPPPPPAPPVAPREWNLWELERRARDRAGDPARDEEWTALFVHLREFANADGVLPTEFDGLVRESFAELIQAA